MSISLVCLPFAGAGASFYKPWEKAGGIDVLALQLPGREWRIAETPLTDVHRAADGLVPDVLAMVPEGDPIVLFGHSLGAVLAFELGHRLAAIPGVRLERVVVSGSPNPWTQREHRATGLPDDAFLGRVEEFAGYTHEALADPEMRELILPVLRADVEMHETYIPADDTPLPVPITAIHGRDDALVTAEQTAQWAAATTGGFELVEVDGGHMYLVEAPERVLAVVETAVASV